MANITAARATGRSRESLVMLHGVEWEVWRQHGMWHARRAVLSARDRSTYAAMTMVDAVRIAVEEGAHR